MAKKNAQQLTSDQKTELFQILKKRFEENMNRHENLEWNHVQTKLEGNPEKLWSVNEMERTGGEPDVVDNISEKGAIVFLDCSKESPTGRRSLCYDREALESRKKFKPENSATDMAKTMGIELLSEEEYRNLQQIGEFDTKTSSWIKTPPEIRKLGGALFGDYRFKTVFIYHNGAESYYQARGFRGSIKI